MRSDAYRGCGGETGARELDELVVDVREFHERGNVGRILEAELNADRTRGLSGDAGRHDGHIKWLQSTCGTAC